MRHLVLNGDRVLRRVAVGHVRRRLACLSKRRVRERRVHQVGRVSVQGGMQMRGIVSSVNVRGTGMKVLQVR